MLFSSARHGLRPLSALLLCGTFVAAVAAAEIEPAADAPKPLPPDESVAKFQVDAGFHVELVAAEPHLADPVTIAFDADGRIYAAELHGYNLDGYFDVQELNKTGELDKTVRRIMAPEWAQEKAKAYTYGTVKLLVDEDGDGQIDRSSTFADRLPPCYGVVAAGDGVIVLCAPHIYFLADRDGDGEAEVREQLFTGFNEGELWSRTNHLVWGLDNWIYACAGRGGSIIVTGPHLKQPVELGNVCYRFRADGSALEPATGNAGGFGLGLSDWGDRFLIHNSTNGLQVPPIPYRYQTRNPFVAAPGGQFSAATYREVYPTSRPHPWRVERGRHKAWREFYGHSEATPNGTFTAACSPTFYRGESFPQAYHGNLFACESQQNLVNRAVPRREGTRIRLHRPEDFAEREFLASTDGWFRPVDLTTGPDGALYVVDMYREIIEDYSAIPRYLQQQYGLEKGGNHGRIWRVVWDDAKKPTRIQLSQASDDALVAALAHDNAVWRQTAQRLLIERGALQTAAALEAAVVDGATPQARLHALYTLEGLGRLTSTCVAEALDDAHFAVRWHGLQLADRLFAADEDLIDRVLRMTDESDATVRLQLALTLGEIEDGRVVDALARLATGEIDDEWYRFAILNSAGTRAAPLLARLLKEGADAPSLELLRPLAEAIGVQGETDALAEVLAAVSLLEGENAADVQLRCLEGLLAGVSDRRKAELESPVARDALERLIEGSESRVGWLSFQLASALRIENLAAVDEMFAAAGRRALDANATIESRQESLELLQHAPFEDVVTIARALLDARQPVELQAGAVSVLAESSQDAVAGVLLDGWESYSPRVRDRILDVLTARSNWLPELLDAMEQGSVEASTIGSLRRVQLLEHPEEAIRTRAERLLASRADDTERELRLAAYREGLDAPRDRERGRQVFVQHCSACHRVEEVGYEIGPPLASAINRPDEALLNEILDPSGRITDGFQSYTVVTTDGRLLVGVLAAESATSVTLRRDKGAEDQVLRQDIDRMVAMSKSLMPENLYEQVRPQDAADLLSYLRDVYGPAGPLEVTLFDDEEQFVDLLPHGRGKAEVEGEDVFAGESALSISALQRYSDRIPDWEFPIVEHPGPGAYRYLRLAWKSIDGEGVGLELADRGDWGPAQSEARRYYSGRNTAPWQAQQINAAAPSEWTVVTIDLWKDNGEFVLTGIAPTAMGGRALFDRITLLRTLDTVADR